MAPVDGPTIRPSLRCRRSVIFQENQLRTLQNELEAKQEEIKLTRIQTDRMELELKSRDERISKLRARLNLAKTNKEYSATLTELNTSKADNSKIENQILDLMKNMESDEDECTEIQNQINQQKEDHYTSVLVFQLRNQSLQLILCLLQLQYLLRYLHHQLDQQENQLHIVELEFSTP